MFFLSRKVLLPFLYRPQHWCIDGVLFVIKHYKPIDFTQQEISNYMILMDNIQNMFSMVIEEQFSFKIDDLRVYLVELCH